jgi:hypothetical protein
LSQLELFTQPVTRVIVDIKDPGVFHACSLNKDIISYDMKKNKPIITHRVANGHVHDITQKKKPEYELSSLSLTTSFLRYKQPYKLLGYRSHQSHSRDTDSREVPLHRHQQEW